MSRYDNFRNNTNIEKSMLNVRIADFIEKHLSSTKVHREGSEDLFSAVLTKTHKEGLEETLLFTYPKEQIKVGEYIVRDKTDYLVFMEYVTPLAQYYTKNSLIQCNITISQGEIKQRGAYKSSLRNFTDTQNESKMSSTFIADIDKPVVITAYNENIKVNSRFLAAGDAYRILNIDSISNEGIMYLSVEPVPHNPVAEDEEKETTVILAAPITEKKTEKIYKAGVEQIVVTNYGYIQFDKQVEITSRTSTLVKFKIPYGINNITVSIKNSKGNIISFKREVV